MAAILADATDQDHQAIRANFSGIAAEARAARFFHCFGRHVVTEGFIFLYNGIAMPVNETRDPALRRKG